MMRLLAKLRQGSKIDLRLVDYIYIVIAVSASLYVYDVIQFTQSCGGVP